jgi:dephospho-CoA kinase
MKLFGLTGGIASGKSIVEKMFRRAGIPVIDADDLSREVTRPHSEGLAKVLSQFGQHLALPDGSLNRKALANLIFEDEAARARLEAIVHPLIANAMQEHISQLTQKDHDTCVYCAPLIFEKNMQGLFEAVILIVCDEKTQIDRLMRRDHLTELEAKLRLDAQMPLIEKQKLTPYQLDNNGTHAHTAEQLEALWRKLTGGKVSFHP